MFHNYAVCGNENLDAEINILQNSKAFSGCDIAIMPDAHAGKSHACIGTAIRYKDKIIPGVVGVDIGCSVSLYHLRSGVFQTDLERLDKVIHENIPAGNHIRNNEDVTSKTFEYDKLRCWDAIKDEEERYRLSMGTLGGGKVDCFRAA